MLNEKGIRELCYIVKIDNIEPIVGSDNCESAVVGGWHIMTRKGTFKPGDLAIYFEIDSKVPESEIFEFLSKKHYKVKTQKYTFGGKGNFISQGLLMHPSDFGWEVAYRDKKCVIDNDGNWHFADDESRFLTQKLGVVYSVEEDNKRKSNSTGDKYKKMAQRHPKLFQNFIIRKIYRTNIGKKILFVFFGKKRDKRNWPEWVQKTDEERCLWKDTKITTDKGYIRIADIVNKKLDVKVLSYNEQSKKCEWKNIVNYQKYPKEDFMIRIGYGYHYMTDKLNHLVCTTDHKVYTQDGYKKAIDLSCDDTLYINHYSLNEVGISAIYGLLLGDGNVHFDRRNNNCPGLRWTQSIHHMNYIEQITKAFNVNYSLDNNEKGYGDKCCKVAFVNPYSAINAMIEDGALDIKNRTWNVTKEFCDRLTPLSIALWYCDDGSKHGENGSTQILSTYSFSSHEIDLLRNRLLDFGIKTSLRTDKKGNSIGILDGGHEFFKLIKDYIPECMQYKLKPEYRNGAEYLKELTMYSDVIIPQKINTIKTIKSPVNSKYVYDIEVEDNHNFFANRILNHNCQNIPWILNDKSEWIATEKIDGTSTTFTMKRGKKNIFGKSQYEFYVCSRNVCFDDPNQSCYYDKNVYIEMAEKFKMKYVLEDIMNKHPEYDWVTIQGETYGAGIQKRDYSLGETGEHLFAGFNFITSTDGRWNSVEAAQFFELYGINWVPIISDHFVLPDTVDELLTIATGNSCIDDGPREGLVFRSKDGVRSFKAVSNEFLLKYHN